MPTYTLTEPTPTRAPNSRLHTGRGGAGNVSRPLPTNSLAPAVSHISTSSTATSAASKFSSGRGGAGNIHPASAQAPFSFADLETPEHAVYHVGRGGSANWAGKDRSTATASVSARKLSSESQDSNASVRSGFMRRLSGVFTR